MGQLAGKDDTVVSLSSRPPPSYTTSWDSTGGASGAEKRRLMKYVLAWAKKVGKGVDKLTDEERKGILQTIVEEVVIDRNDYVKITLAIPVDYNFPELGSPEPESVAFASKVPSR